MSIKTTSVSFAQPTLTRISGRPDYTSLLLLRRELLANAMGIHTTLGGGQNGHIGLLLTPEEYEMEAPGTPFIIPDHPGPAPTPANDTAHAHALAVRIYDSIIEVRDKAQLVTIGLRAQLLAAIDATFIMDLQHAQFGYARVTLPKFLAHLFDNYGKISQPALNKNQASLATAWNPEEPLTMLWTRLTNIQEFATAGGAPLSDRFIIDATCDLFERHGIFANSLLIWQAHSEDVQTMENFKAHFKKVTSNASWPSKRLARSAITARSDLLMWLTASPAPPPLISPPCPTTPWPLPLSLPRTSPVSRRRSPVAARSDLLIGPTASPAHPPCPTGSTEVGVSPVAPANADVTPARCRCITGRPPTAGRMASDGTLPTRVQRVATLPLGTVPLPPSPT